MKLFQRIFFAAVLAGLAAGLVMTGLQQWRVVPLILEAESFESAVASLEHVHDDGSVHQHEAAAAEPGGHVHDADAWAPADGVERTFYTVLANLLASAGFALILAATSVFAGLPLTASNGALWGLGGFVAFQLAPAFGLPPELPGMAAAELDARQLWWWSTALATGAGLLAVAKLRNWTGVGIAAVLILLPQIIGAPQLAAHATSTVPAHLATEFAATSLATGAVFWLILGPLMGWLDGRLAARETATLKGAIA